MTKRPSAAQNPGASQRASGAHRFGRVVGTAAGDVPGSYLVRDEETDSTYRFSDADIVTEGFRAARAGERVRFLIDPGQPGQAHYVIRLDLPEIGEYYK